MNRTRSKRNESHRDVVRCAIYTRKSTEEGLDQEFNTLDAQRESGEAYIVSQRHEGWECLPDRWQSWSDLPGCTADPGPTGYRGPKLDSIDPESCPAGSVLHIDRKKRNPRTAVRHQPTPGWLTTKSATVLPYLPALGQGFACGDRDYPAASSCCWMTRAIHTLAYSLHSTLCICAICLAEAIPFQKSCSPSRNLPLNGREARIGPCGGGVAWLLRPGFVV